MGGTNKVTRRVLAVESTALFSNFMNSNEHIITVLAEEGGEVAKECSKALRFGLDDKLTIDPNGPRGTDGPTNAEKIGAEFVDMLAIYLLAAKEGLVPKIAISIKCDDLMERIMKKQTKVRAYMGYAARVGALENSDYPTAVRVSEPAGEDGE